MENKKLTIVITTYNRQQSLIEQLQSIERQGHYDEYQIVISDNCSNYDVKHAIDDNFKGDFRNIIDVHSHAYNMGGDINIALSFQLANTPWMWLLSDDDLTLPGSLEAVLRDCDTYADVCWLKYSRNKTIYPERKIDNIEELFLAFCNVGSKMGEFIFMSNNVYNMERIKPFIGCAPLYASTCFSQCIPPMLAMKKNGETMQVLSTSVVDYVPNRISYNLHYAYSNFINFIYTSFGISESELKAYKKLNHQVGNNLGKVLLELPKGTLRDLYFRRFYSFYNNPKQRIYLCCFYFLPEMAIKILTKLKRMLVGK